MADTVPTLRPAPDLVMVAGALAATAGYLLPWFKQSSSYDWSYSGWSYATLSTGGGWTLLTLVMLAAALLASLWAGRSTTAAMTGAAAGVGAAVFALAVVAASFANVDERDSVNYITEFPFGVGLPLLAGGLGLLIAGACRAIVTTVLASRSERV